MCKPSLNLLFHLRLKAAGSKVYWFYRIFGENIWLRKWLVGEMSNQWTVYQGTINEGTGRSEWQLLAHSSSKDIFLTGHFPTIKQCPSSVFLYGKVMYPAQQRKTRPTLCWNQSNFPEHLFSTSDWFLTNFIWYILFSHWLVEHSSVVCNIHLLNVTPSHWSYLETEYFLLFKLLLRLTIASNFISFYVVIFKRMYIQDK